MSASILKDSFVIYVLAHLLYAHEVPNRMHQIKPGITIIKLLQGFRYSIQAPAFWSSPGRSIPKGSFRFWIVYAFAEIYFYFF